ncbi:MAG TPA: MCE family protein [Actinomycetota bacterium]|nr:MCE family protein [Actinomycetota bacterium]
MTGLLALCLMGAAVAFTGLTLTGSIGSNAKKAYAEFENCGQGLREGGDVKLRGVLVGRLGPLERIEGGDCRVRLDLFPDSMSQIPANAGAEIRAKTVFGEKWLELVYPDDPSEARLAAGDLIPKDRTLDPIEVETILNTGLPLLEAIDPENLSAALEALSEGFEGQEGDVIASIRDGIRALRPLNENRDLLEGGIAQLDQSSDVLNDVDEDLLEAMANLDEVNEFTIENQRLIDENLERAPLLLDELSVLFETRFGDLTKLVDRGATVIGLISSRTDDLEKLLTVLPQFNSKWIRNLTPVCRYRQTTTEPGREVGDRVPGRCWRVHNIVSHSQGAYGPGDGPQPRTATVEDFEAAGLEAPSDLGQLLYTPAIDPLLDRLPGPRKDGGR